MAYLEARAGIARAGVTYAGWASPRVQLKIAGTDRTSTIHLNTWRVEDRIDGPSIASFTVNGTSYTPTVGQTVSFLFCTPNEWLFTGVILRARVRRVQKNSGTTKLWDCEAVDDTWLLDRYARPVIEIENCGINTAVRRILDQFTNGGFLPGTIPAALGNVDSFSADGSETVSQCLVRLARSVDAYVRVTPYRTVDVFEAGDLADGHVTAWGNSTALGELEYEVDLSQVRNKTYCVGKAVATTASAGAGATTISVDECGWFASSGGTILVGANLATYTGVSAASGPGTLTGVSGIAARVGEGDTVSVVGVAEDTTAQTDMAATLGGGLSGVITHRMEDGRVNATTATAMAASDVAFFKDAITAVSGMSRERHIAAGQTRTITITDPMTISGTVLIHSVEITPGPRVNTTAGGPAHLLKRIQASRYQQSVRAFLRRVA